MDKTDFDIIVNPRKPEDWEVAKKIEKLLQWHFEQEVELPAGNKQIAELLHELLLKA